MHSMKLNKGAVKIAHCTQKHAVAKNYVFLYAHHFEVIVFLLLKDKSGVGMIVDYSRDYTVVNGV